MDRWKGAAILSSALGLAVAFPLAVQDASAADKDTKKSEPFYRRYLVPGAALDDRIREQEKRVEQSPDDADLRNDFGNLLAARRFPKEAREQYEAAMKLDKANWMAPYNLGMLEESVGRSSRATSAYEKSVDRNRGFPPSRFRLGRMYERHGRNADAIREYSRALEIDPEMRDVRHNPLAAETRLMDRVSLEMYSKDAARASMKTQTTYADERFRRLPVDRVIWSSDVAEPPAEPEPADTRATAPRSPAPLLARPGETRPQDLGTRPVAPPPPSPVPLQPTPAPAEPDNSLGLRPRPPLPTPLPQ